MAISASCSKRLIKFRRIMSHICLVAVARRTYFDKFVSQHLSGAGSSPAGSVGRDLNLQKLRYQYLTTSVAVVLVHNKLKLCFA